MPLTVVRYDLEESPRSGFGCWGHDYNGTIANTLRTVSGVVSCGTNGNEVVSYFEGSGTINDGLYSTTTAGTHLLYTGAADDGLPVSPVLSLYFAAPVTIETIRIFGGDIGGNAVPGALDGVTVEFGGTSVTLATTPAGTPNAIGVPSDDIIDLTGTVLEGVPTHFVVLRGFTASLFGSPFNQISITEITVAGTPPAFQTVPIDIKPGDKSNTINPGSNGKIEVAILSTSTFNAVTETDQSGLTFGRTGSEASFISCGSPKDVNKDKRKDLVCLFSTKLTGFALGDTEGVLQGATTLGAPIRGTDSVRIAP